MNRRHKNEYGMESNQKVLDLQFNDEFSELSIQQLLFACIDGAGILDTLIVLASTPWKNYTANSNHTGSSKRGKIHSILIKEKGKLVNIDLSNLSPDDRAEIILQHI